jgi:hypothetical protein
VIVASVIINKLFAYRAHYLCFIHVLVFFTGTKSPREPLQYSVTRKARMIPIAIQV